LEVLTLGFQSADVSLDSIQPFAHTLTRSNPAEDVAESTEESDETHGIETDSECDHEQRFRERSSVVDTIATPSQPILYISGDCMIETTARPPNTN